MRLLAGGMQVRGALLTDRRRRKGFAARKARRGTDHRTAASPLVIVLVAVVLVTVGTLAVMNKAGKSSQHAWCAPMSTVRHDIKTG